MQVLCGPRGRMVNKQMNKEKAKFLVNEIKSGKVVYIVKQKNNNEYKHKFYIINESEEFCLSSQDDYIVEYIQYIDFLEQFIIQGILDIAPLKISEEYAFEELLMYMNMNVKGE